MSSLRGFDKQIPELKEKIVAVLQGDSIANTLSLGAVLRSQDGQPEALHEGVVLMVMTQRVFPVEEGGTPDRRDNVQDGIPLGAAQAAPLRDLC